MTQQPFIKVARSHIHRLVQQSNQQLLKRIDLYFDQMEKQLAKRQPSKANAQVSPKPMPAPRPAADEQLPTRPASDSEPQLQAFFETLKNEQEATL